MISTAELTAWLRAIPTVEDDLIRSLERAAVAYINEPGGAYFGARTTITEEFKWRGGTQLIGNEVTLGDGEEFTLEEWDGTAWGAVDASRYLLSGRLLYISGSWPTGGSHFRVSYPAGYTAGDPQADPAGDPDVWDAPEDIKQVVRMLTAHWYTNREAAVVGVTSDEVALGVRMILAKYR